MSQKPGPGDCVKLVSEFSCGCEPEWDWDCLHDDGVPHGLQRIFEDRKELEEICERPDCPCQEAAESEAKQEEGMTTVADKPGTAACVKQVVIFTCGHNDDTEWDCDHFENVQHDKKPQIAKIYSEDPCSVDCPGRKKKKPLPTHEIGEDGIRRPFRRLSYKRPREITPEELKLNPQEELEFMEAEFKIPSGGTWEQREWEEPWPSKNPYEGIDEREQRARDELHATRKRGQDHRRWINVSEKAKHWRQRKKAKGKAQQSETTRETQDETQQPKTEHTDILGRTFFM